MTDVIFEIEVSSGNKKVKITNDSYSLELYTMRNGYQWTGQPVDDEILDLIVACIEKYKSNLTQKE